MSILSLSCLQGKLVTTPIWIIFYVRDLFLRLLLSFSRLVGPNNDKYRNNWIGRYQYIKLVVETCSVVESPFFLFLLYFYSEGDRNSIKTLQNPETPLVSLGSGSQVQRNGYGCEYTHRQTSRQYGTLPRFCTKTRRTTSRRVTGCRYQTGDRSPRVYG